MAYLYFPMHLRNSFQFINSEKRIQQDFTKINFKQQLNSFWTNSTYISKKVFIVNGKESFINRNNIKIQQKNQQKKVERKRNAAKHNTTPLTTKLIFCIYGYYWYHNQINHYAYNIMKKSREQGINKVRHKYLFKLGSWYFMCCSVTNWADSGI